MAEKRRTTEHMSYISEEKEEMIDLRICHSLKLCFIFSL